jgi:PKD repeat protein
VRVYGGFAGIVVSVLLAGLAAGSTAQAGVTPSGHPAPATAAGTTLYVDITRFGACNDDGPGTQAEPFCTVQHAANVVNPGQTVAIMASEVDQAPQSVTITRSGTPAEPITFTSLRTASDPDDPVLSPGNQTGKAVVTFDEVHDVALSDLQIVNNGTVNGIDVIGSRDISVDGATITHGANLESPVESAAVSIDGGSSNVTVSRTFFAGTPRYAVLAATGAHDVTVTTNAVQRIEGSGFALNGTTGATVTGNTIIVSVGCTVNGPVNGITLADGTSGTVENNVLVTAQVTSCAVPSTGLSVDASSADSAGGVTADYNAFIWLGSGGDYSWAGTAYASPASFAAATGQGTHDVALTKVSGTTQPEGSPAIDSANCLAPGELSTDIIGKPRVRDPLATDASLGNGTCYADRGAYERQDNISLTSTAPPPNSAGYPAGTVPYKTGVTVTSAATSPWGEPVSYSVNFGDGGTAVAATPGTAVTHQYTAVGQYTITITAEDTSGSTTSEVYTVSALPDQPFKAALSAAPLGLGTAIGIIPDEVAFADTSGIPDWEVSSRTIAYGGAGQGSGFGSPENTGTYTYAKPGTYTATETVTDLLGRVSKATATITVGDEQQSVFPKDIYGRDLAAHTLAKIPLSELDLGDCCADAALVDVIVTSPRKTGYVSVYPNGTTRPADPTVRFQAGKAAENSVLATGGTVDFYNGSTGTVHLDIVTYGIDDITNAGGDGVIGETYAPVAPARVLNTRIAGNHSAEFHVAGLDSIPANASDVVLAITASKGATAGSYTTHTPGLSAFAVTAGYWAKGQQVTNLARVSPGDRQVFVDNDGAGAANFSAYVVGYYVSGGNAAVFLPAAGQRLARITIGAKKSARLTVVGKYGVPARGTTAVAVNLTASGTMASGTVTAYADGTKLPGLISLSYARGAEAANAAIAATGADGAIRLYNGGARPVTITVDLTGSYYRYG